MFQLRSVPIVSDVVVTLLSSIAVLTPNGSFFLGLYHLCIQCAKCSFNVDTRVVKLLRLAPPPPTPPVMTFLNVSLVSNRRKFEPKKYKICDQTELNTEINSE